MRHSLRSLCCLGVVLFCALARAEVREYALILEDPPVSRAVSSRRELAGKAALEARDRIRKAQGTLRQELEQRKVRVHGAVNTLLNAVFVTTGDAAKLAALPGVKGVVRTRTLKHHLHAALPLVNAAQGWTALAGAGYPNAGAGVKIGIIDTGIDQTHPGFQDTSLTAPAGYPKCTGADCAYTNSKVIVARSYVRIVAAGTGAGDSRPDDYSARDRSGPGTAAAMIAAGVQHTAPLGTISGVAPKAFLGNYKIFGSPGVNDTTRSSALIQALEDAYNDGMDVVTVTTGIPPIYAWDATGAECGEGAGVSCDIESTAVENAVRNHGMAVVVSAGNDAPYALSSPALSTISSPGLAPSAVTVGASRNGHLIRSQAGLTAPDAPAALRSIAAAFGDSLRTRVTAPLRDVGGDGFACAALPAGSLAGAVALVQRSVDACDFYTKTVNAMNAGAVGVLIYREAGADEPYQPEGMAGLNVPVAGIGYSSGLALKQRLQTHPDAQITLDPAWISSDDGARDTVAAFSSRGPAIGTYQIKPELVAPGTSIYTATQRYDTKSRNYNASGYTVMEGTSLAAPMVAGAIALVKQRNPGFSAAQLKSAVVNTAGSGVLEGGAPASIAAVGAGKLNLEAAVNTNVTVTPSTLSFGLASNALGGSRQLSVQNGSASPLALAVAQTTPDTNAHLRLSRTTIAAGQTDTVVVYLEGTLPAPGAYEGFITIQGGAVNLRVPYTYFVGDGVPANLLNVYDLGRSQAGQDRFLIALRALDRYGVEVTGAPVTWNTTSTAYVDPSPSGGADAQTSKYGVAAARVFPGATPGELSMTASVGAQPLRLAFHGTARVQPAISAGGVVNAASGTVAQAGQGVAPGSYISIYGQNLSDAIQDFGAMLAQGVDPYLPVSLGGVSVSFDVPAAGLSVPGRLHFVSRGQINVQVPWELTGQGSALIKVRVGATVSAVYTLYLSDRAPGVFEYPFGSGTAAAVDALSGALVTAAAPIAKGRWVALYINGLGPVPANQRPASGEMTPAQGLVSCTDTPVVTIGGRPATINFAGLVPTGIGYYQINALVPADAPSGLQPVTITIGGTAAKTVNLPIQ